MNIEPYLKSGFALVPDEPYLIHKTREQIYLIDGEELISLKIKTLVYRVVENPLTGSIRVFHRLKALAFIPFPDGLNKDNAICNHKDGDKFNNDIFNLEWTTHSGNNTHAVMTGLRSDNITGICEDIVTKKTYEFYSLWHLSSMIGLHAGLVSRYIKKPREYPFRNRFNISVLGRETNSSFTIDDIWKSGGGSPTPIILTNTETGEKTYWGTFTNMVRKLNKPWVFKKKLVPGKIIKFDNGKYEVVIATAYSDIVKGHKENEEWAKKCAIGISTYSPPGKRVEVIDGNNNISVYENLRDCSEKLSLPYPALKKAMSKKRERYKGLKFKYL